MGAPLCLLEVPVSDPDRAQIVIFTGSEFEVADWSRLSNPLGHQRFAKPRVEALQAQVGAPFCLLEVPVRHRQHPLAKRIISPYSGRDCVKSLRSFYTGLYPQTPRTGSNCDCLRVVNFKFSLQPSI